MGEYSDRTGNFVLSNGEYTLTLTESGSGAGRWRDFLVRRTRPDLCLDAWGFFLYIRDIQSGRYWSSTYQPTRAMPIHYRMRGGTKQIEYQRFDDGIDSLTEIALAPDSPLELWTLSLTNRGRSMRNLEITSYQEIVLAPEGSDLAHPVYSNLFVQTEFDRKARAVISSRRPKAKEDRTFWVAHFLRRDEKAGAGEFEYETDRAKFLGRGRDVSNPIAMEGQNRLRGTVGAVLDPIASCRTRIRLAPGRRARIFFITAVADSRSHLMKLLARQGSLQALRRIHKAAGGAEDRAFRHAWIVPKFENRELSKPAGRRPRPAATASKNLCFFNGLGGFTTDGREYVIALKAGTDTPAPWVNVVSNPGFGFQVSERGSGYTWAENSRENKLTPWSNDPVSDPPGEILYLRDETSGEIWTPTAAPIRDNAPYLIRHGQGYSIFEHESHGIRQELCMFVPADEPVKILRLRLTNTQNRRRTLSATFYVEWVLAAHRPPAMDGQVPKATRMSRQRLRPPAGTRLKTSIDPATGSVLASNPDNKIFAQGITFLDGVGGKRAATTDRRHFIGVHGDLRAPAALIKNDISGGEVNPEDACGAIQLKFSLPKRGTKEIIFLLGQSRKLAAVRRMVRLYRRPAAVAGAFRKMAEGWDNRLGAVEVRTPNAAMDFMLNRWLLYQTLSCRFLSRSAFYQSGGAFGFRDQLQDSRAFLYAAPDIVREHILRSARRQFVEGDVQHWWHVPWGFGPRTRCSDDLIWLPYVLTDYLSATGDQHILNERLTYVADKLVPPHEQEIGCVPRVTKKSGTLYEHCIKALDRGIRLGRYGLPLIGSCDWNDGMNRVGHRGKGVSVWMAWFLIDTLNRFIPVCEAQGEKARAGRYREIAQRLSESIERHAWDGKWYRRAYTDDGEPLGSATNDECRIDSLAQTWAVISGAGRPDRVASAMRSLEKYLIKPKDGLILLLTPPFDRSKLDPGYIKGYVPGVRENGGQYTHAATWVALAFAKLGLGDKAIDLYNLLNPIHHARTPAEVAKYKVEPYVMAADVYGVAPHTGRGGWTWYTGSSAWMYRIGIEWILGLKLRGRTFRVDPCVPRGWRRYSMVYRFRNTRYVIRVENPSSGRGGVKSVRVDSRKLKTHDIPLMDDGRTHQVKVLLE